MGGQAIPREAHTLPGRAHNAAIQRRGQQTGTSPTQGDRRVAAQPEPVRTWRCNWQYSPPLTHPPKPRVGLWMGPPVRMHSTKKLGRLIRHSQCLLAWCLSEMTRGRIVLSAIGGLDLLFQGGRDLFVRGASFGLWGKAGGIAMGWSACTPEAEGRFMDGRPSGRILLAAIIKARGHRIRTRANTNSYDTKASAVG